MSLLAKWLPEYGLPKTSPFLYMPCLILELILFDNPLGSEHVASHDLRAVYGDDGSRID